MSEESLKAARRVRVRGSRSPTEAGCVFCKALPDKSKEHIVLSAIGGRKKSKGVTCAWHNGDCGNGIDNALAEQLAPITTLLGIKRDRAGSLPTLKGVVSSPNGSEKWDLAPGLKPRLPKSIVERTESDGQVEIHLRTNGHSGTRQLELAEQILKRYGKTIEDVSVSSTFAVEKLSADGVKIEIEFGGEKALRAVAKMAFLLLADSLGVPMAKGPEFRHLRDFIEYGRGSADEFVKHDYATPCPQPESLHGSDGFAHRVIVIGDPATATIVGHVELYGAFHCVVLLSRGWGGPTFSIGHSVDPITGETRNDDGFFSDAFSVEEFCAIDGHSRAVDVAFERLGPKLVRRLREQTNEQIVSTAMRRVFGSSDDDRIVSREELDRFGCEVARDWLYQKMGVPQRTEVSLAELLSEKRAGDRDKGDS